MSLKAGGTKTRITRKVRISSLKKAKQDKLKESRTLTRLYSISLHN